MIVIDSTTSLEDIIVDTIYELGWRNDNIDLLHEVPLEYKKELGVVVAPEFFYDGINKRYSRKQIEKISKEWLEVGNVEKYDKYLLSRLQPNISKYLELHNKKFVKISICGSAIGMPKPSTCDTYKVSKKKIILIEEK